MGAGIGGATVKNGVDGFGSCGEFSLVNDISVNYPLVIEVVDEQSKNHHKLSCNLENTTFL
jgi:PII-like signaling protein